MHKSGGRALLKSNKPERTAPSPTKFSRRRAFSLIGLHVLVGAHIIHWKMTGKTLAPLEFNEATLGTDNGLITAGLIFMAVAILSVVFFGRLFCGWACHILALQDLCALLLRKIGIQPKPLRSRLLFFLPVAILFYMFFWTPFHRLLIFLAPSTSGWLGIPNPFTLRAASEGADMASFVTSDLWRNLPGPGIAMLTFAICGFMVVYFMGSRGFCAYVCPYGTLFSWADKITPGKILLTGDCTACGKCTASCKSGVNVMHEVRQFGKVIDTACFKDMDCVASCPEEALSFGFAKPTLFSKEKSPSKPFSFSTLEEVSMLMVFTATLLILVGLPESLAPWAGRLYGLMPMFLSATLAVLTAVVAIYMARLFRRPQVAFQNLVLKQGTWRPMGIVFASAVTVWMIFIGHSALVQYHMFRAGRIIHAEKQVLPSFPSQAADPTKVADAGAVLLVADAHLRIAQELGFFYSDRRISRQRAWLALALGDTDRCEIYLHQAIALEPGHPDSRFQLGWVLAAHGKTLEGLRELDRVDSLSLEGRFKGSILKGTLQLGYHERWNQALDLLEAASLSRSADTIFHRKMLNLVQKIAGPQASRELLERILRRDPSHAAARASMANWAEVQSNASQTLEGKPTSPRQ